MYKSEKEAHEIFSAALAAGDLNSAKQAYDFVSNQLAAFWSVRKSRRK